ncbi:HpcH/HpaI aldolase/citrate lyase family protein [Nesterenkonia sphaerica]|uniref:CoA ester lyase n=1 Tax=Nesterenkonia sphaerica TaxID=1804988 RepID=A0A5R9A3V6_9MICC|nr:CoA ester lyase [Nesterenkonia sphaerica]TLP72874.1 CoA ester lyase [Nesterenkonia sphaerica]
MIDETATLLFVPADRPDRFEKACMSGADAIIIDLEDALAASQKDAARARLRRELPNLNPRDVLVGVRVNSAATEHLPEDGAFLADLADHIDFVVLPEVQGIEDLQLLEQHVDGVMARLPVVALIESSRGIVNALAIAEYPAVRRLALGAADLSHEWQIEPTGGGEEFDYVRQQLVIASRAAGLNGPIDTPHMNVQDSEGLSARMGPIVQLGMKGKLCIHPSQVEIARKGFLVTEEEFHRLRELISVFEDAEGQGNASIKLSDGSFIDYPVYRRAVRHVEAYERFHGINN